MCAVRGEESGCVHFCLLFFSKNIKVNRFSPLKKESFSSVELSLLLSRVHTFFFNPKEHIAGYIGEYWQHIKGYEGYRATDGPNTMQAGSSR